jgi:hypothetical protein
MYRQKLLRVFYDLVQKHKENGANGSNGDRTTIDTFTDWFSLKRNEDANGVLADILEKSGTTERELSFGDSDQSVSSTNNNLATKARITSRVVLKEPEDVVGLL